jgi:hypothetical protein
VPSSCSATNLHLILVTHTSTLLSSIPHLELFVDQQVEVDESFSFLKNWTAQMRSTMTRYYMVSLALMNVMGHKSHSVSCAEKFLQTKV